MIPYGQVNQVKNNVCPVGYRLPLDPNGANDGENEWYEETQTWSSKNKSGAINSVLKLPMSGNCDYWEECYELDSK